LAPLPPETLLGIEPADVPLVVPGVMVPDAPGVMVPGAPDAAEGPDSFRLTLNACPFCDAR
jgi:hypothetical protein